MDSKTPYLLKDIKELLLGIGLVLISIALFVMGGFVLLLEYDLTAILMWTAGIMILLCGVLFLVHGWASHKLEEPGEADGLD